MLCTRCSPFGERCCGVAAVKFALRQVKFAVQVKFAAQVMFAFGKLRIHKIIIQVKFALRQVTFAFGKLRIWKLL